MDIRHLVEKPDGSVVFQGILSGKELLFVVETGLNTLIEMGHVPFLSTESFNIADIHNVPDQEQ